MAPSFCLSVHWFICCLKLMVAGAYHVSYSGRTYWLNYHQNWCKTVVICMCCLVIASVSMLHTIILIVEYCKNC